MPHHGSRYSSPAFLTAVGPRVVLVSVGAGNTYGQPNLPLLSALEGTGAVVRRTDTSGTWPSPEPSRWRQAAPNFRSSRAATRRPPAGGGVGSAGGVVPAAGFEPALSTT